MSFSFNGSFWMNALRLGNGWLRKVVFCLVCCGLALPGTCQSLSQLMAQYSGYDMDGNGTREIEGLSYLPFEAPASQEVPSDGRLVLVEPRLL